MFQVKVVSPKHRLIKVDSQEFGRCKVPLSTVTIQEEPVRTDLFLFPQFYVFTLSNLLTLFLSSHISCSLICEMLFVSLSLPRWYLLLQQRRTLTQIILTPLMSVQTQEADRTGSPNLHQQIAAATWSHSRPSGSSQVNHDTFSFH